MRRPPGRNSGGRGVRPRPGVIGPHVPHAFETADLFGQTIEGPGDRVLHRFDLFRFGDVGREPERLHAELFDRLRGLLAVLELAGADHDVARAADADLTPRKKSTVRVGAVQARPRIIADNGPQFIARDFKEFIRISGMTHVRTSPYYPQSNGKIERWHKSLKGECIRPGTPLTPEDARRLIQQYVDHYNTVRLHSAIGFVTPAEMLAGRQKEIHAARDRKLEEARRQRQLRPRRQPRWPRHGPWAWTTRPFTPGWGSIIGRSRGLA